ncbi:MAG: pyridoxal-phosphate dependent enzyme [Chitinophagales bacterium]|nr:pyridoxal-phosphate dependent enzyme [Chitinophagales bacterium]
MLQLPTPLQQIREDFIDDKNIKLFIKRDDLIHTLISGNKWRKLKYNIEAFKQSNKKYILTFGGAFSNHITATAATGKWLNIPTIGIIRGEELHKNSNVVLQEASQNGMQLYFVDRTIYRQKEININIFKNSINKNWNDVFVIEEGGANALAMKGCEEIVHEINIDFNFIYTASGTATTAFGLANACKNNQQVVAISALKGIDYIKSNLYHQVKNKNVLQFKQDIFGGYAKYNNTLIEFIKNFHQQHHILLDYIYTGKMMYQLYHDIKENSIPNNSTVVALHTGGIANANYLKLAY